MKREGAERGGEVNVTYKLVRDLHVAVQSNWGLSSIWEICQSFVWKYIIIWWKISHKQNP